MFASLVGKTQNKVAKSNTRTHDSKAPQAVPGRSGTGAAEQILMLQRTVGNQATIRLLSQRAGRPAGSQSIDLSVQKAEPMHIPDREATPGLVWDFSKGPLFSPDLTSRSQASSPLTVNPLPGIIQPKLVVGEVNDPLEHEADRVADEVMRMLTPALTIPPASPQLRRKCASCEEEEVQTLRTERAGTSNAGAKREVPSIVHEVLHSPGQPLDAGVRNFMEPRFGHDFSSVRVHTDAHAAQSACDLDALAYTQGRHIVFASGQFEPYAKAGQRLLAHELTHVVQQGAAGQETIRRSYGVTSDDAWGKLEQPDPPVQISAPGETPELQRQQAPTAGSPGTAPVAPPAPATATPTLTLSPGAALTRGSSLTATVGFTPTSGETMNVTDWQYTSAAGDTVTRPATDPTFQSQWTGVMALSGNIQLSYTVTPRGGAAAAGTPVSTAVTVNDRTGPGFVSTITDAAETPFGGQPSPPQLFSQLGIHHSNATPLPTPTSTTIADGPNAAFAFVSSVTAGGFRSAPQIHPDVTGATSRFRVFHRDPSRLHFVTTSGTRNLIPLAEYSSLSISGGTITFTVPDWTAFTKRHHVFAVTASSGGRTVPLQNSWWNFTPNSMTGALNLTNEPAIRAALHISAADAFNFSASSNGNWEGFQLMPSASIQTGTQSHEYRHAVHSHRANFHAMMRALDPRRKIESTVSTPSNPVTFATKISDWWAEIIRPNHELVDEAASRAAEAFVAVSGATMAGVNTDPNTGNFLGSVWDITNDTQMT